MMIFDYASKQELIRAIGSPLKVVGEPETRQFVTLLGRNQPVYTGFNNAFYAQVRIEHGLIKEVK
jgi:hypothetical protein